MDYLLLNAEELKEIVAKALAECYFKDISDTDTELKIPAVVIKAATMAAQLAAVKTLEKVAQIDCAEGDENE